MHLHPLTVWILKSSQKSQGGVAVFYIFIVPYLLIIAHHYVN